MQQQRVGAGRDVRQSAPAVAVLLPSTVSRINRLSRFAESGRWPRTDNPADGGREVTGAFPLWQAVQPGAAHQRQAGRAAPAGARGLCHRGAALPPRRRPRAPARPQRLSQARRGLSVQHQVRRPCPKRSVTSRHGDELSLCKVCRRPCAPQAQAHIGLSRTALTQPAAPRLHALAVPRKVPGVVLRWSGGPPGAQPGACGQEGRPEGAV